MSDVGKEGLRGGLPRADFPRLSAAGNPSFNRQATHTTQLIFQLKLFRDEHPPADAAASPSPFFLRFPELELHPSQPVLAIVANY